MPKPRVSTIAARVTLKERHLLERAARKQDRTLSDWMRLTLVVEAEIQLKVDGATRLEPVEQPR